MRRVGEIATTGPYSGPECNGPVVFRDGIYHFLREEPEYSDEEFADLPRDWYDRAWAECD